MKNYSHYLLLFVGLYLFMFSTGCPDDGTGGGTSLPPEILLESGAGLVSANTDLPFGQAFTVRVRLSDGDATLRDLAVTKDGVNVPPAELSFDGGAVTSNNPLLIVGADQTGVTYDITITPANPSAGSNTYLFRVTDSDGLFDSEGITINYLSNPPSIVLNDAAGFISADATLTTLNTTFDVQVTLDDTDNLLSSFSVFEDDVLLPAENLEFNAGAFTSANPLTLLSTEQMGITYNLQVTPTSTAVGTRSYRFEAVDSQGQIGSVPLRITFEESTLEMTLTGVLFNSAGPVGTGGLDLDTGTGTGSNDPDAEIQDEGVDENIVPANNWRQQISAANDAELRLVDLTALPDGFSFATVTSQDQIVAAYNSGMIPNGNDDIVNPSDDVENEIVTEVITGNELLTVLRNGRYYLIEITEVNVVVDDPATTPDEDNGDNYVLNIKY